jgi:hypothetical protein
MKKKIELTIIVALFTIQFANAQATVGSDTLYWLQTNIAVRSDSHFKGKRLKTLFDSLYQLKNCIKEYNPPLSLKHVSGEISSDPRENDPVYLYVKTLTFYFDEIGGGSLVNQIHRNNNFNNWKNNTNNIVNTHVKFLKVTFKEDIKYPRFVAESPNGNSIFTPFAEYFWSPYVVESVSVGEY